MTTRSKDRSYLQSNCPAGPSSAWPKLFFGRHGPELYCWIRNHTSDDANETKHPCSANRPASYGLIVCSGDFGREQSTIHHQNTAVALWPRPSSDQVSDPAALAADGPDTVGLISQLRCLRPCPTKYRGRQVVDKHGPRAMAYRHHGLTTEAIPASAGHCRGPQS